MSKRIEFGDVALDNIEKGAKILHDAVVSTLGPHGRNVLISDIGADEAGKATEFIRATKDGVSVAKSIRVHDEVENIGVNIIRKAADRTASIAGDGTTTTTLLAYNLLKEGRSYVKSGRNVVHIKNGMTDAVEDVCHFLRSKSFQIENQEQVVEIASLSANNDNKIGTLVATAIDEVGRTGVVSIETSKTGEDSLELVEGIEFDRGFKSPYFVTDNNTMTCKLDNPYILMYDGVIVDYKDILAISERMAQVNRPLLIIAEDVEREALAFLLQNKNNGRLLACAVKAPGYGDNKKMILEDIAILTGGTVLSRDKGHILSKMSADEVVAFLGTSNSASVAKGTTTIIDGGGSKEAIEDRIKVIKAQIEKPGISDFEKEQIQKRLARIVGGIAVIYVGGNTDIEMKERKDLVEDSLRAVQSSFKEGYLPGGGLSFLIAQLMLSNEKDENENADYILGKKIVYGILDKPIRKILENAGVDNIDNILNEIIANSYDDNGSLKIDWVGYNIDSKKYEVFSNIGIIDPTLVLMTSLKQALTAATTILCSSTVVSDILIRGK